jgi:predicted phosphodiesterase
MSNLTWLHLSDWHQKESDPDREAVRDALLEDLQGRGAIDPRLAKIDFIVFSGDLAFSGSTAEYEVAGRELLDPILAATDVSKDRLLIVPGNHDLARSSLKLMAPLLSVLQTEQQVNNYLTDLDSRDALFAPMKAYSRFIRQYLGVASPEDPCYGYLRAFSVRGAPIALVGMNSAWMCAQHEEINPLTREKEVRDQGYLLLGEPQFSAAMRTREFKEAKLRIGVLHHPCDWFNKDLARWPVQVSLDRIFDVLLRGHEHRSLAAGVHGTDGSCVTISAGAAYDRREYPNGYNFVHFDFEVGQGTVFFRRYDEGRGFHKDTVTTGDETPGVYSFDLVKNRDRKPKAAASVFSGAISALSVHLVLDASSEDVLEALDLYAERIPEDEQFQTPDIIRWLREDQAARATGKGPRDFFFVAKQMEQVRGFTLLHYHSGQNLAFIAYMVAEKGVGIERGTISSRLMAEVAQLFTPGGALSDCKGILLEVDDPRWAATDEQRRERVARIRLFCNLAEREGFTLRALDFDYRQPLLELPVAGHDDQEVPMLLMYAQRLIYGVDGTLSCQRVQSLLDFIYKWLYPEGFSAIPSENEAYRAYLDGFYADQIARLPDTVPTLGLAQIGVRRQSE